jgi:hypothetical protein
MKTMMLTSLVAGLFALICQADEPLLPVPKKNDWYTKAVKKHTVTVDPVEAKPGQTVTLKISFELAEGYTTYPTVQPDKNAEGMVNKITYPEAGAVIFVGETLDPVKFKKKAELDVGIKELRYYEGKLSYERKFVVNPTQKPGEIKIEIPSFKLMVCDAKNCFPAKNLKPEAKLKVLAGPAVAVEKEFADEVQKALNGM